MNGPNASGKDASLRLVDGDAYVGTEDHAKVREAMKHSVRDWIKEGRREPSASRGKSDTLLHYNPLSDPRFALVAELCNMRRCVISPQQFLRELQLIAGFSRIC